MPHEGEVKTWIETKYGDQIAISGICSIGRAESNNVIISKGSVSRHHAVIHERDNEYWIVDLGGINGLSVNGTRVIQSARLQSGDRIQLPTTDFIFRREVVPAQAPTAAAPKARPASEAPSKPSPTLIPADTSKPSDVTVPLPTLVKAKPTRQEELPLGLPPEPAQQTGKLPKARVYVGPVDTQGLPKAPAKVARPAASPETAAAKPSALPHSPTQVEDSLKITAPLSPPAPSGKPKEIALISAPDVIVPTVAKPVAPPALPPVNVAPVAVPTAKPKADSFLQPTTVQQEAATIAKPQESPRSSQEIKPTPKADPVIAPQNIGAVPEQKQMPKKARAVEPVPEVDVVSEPALEFASEDSPLPQGTPCPAAKQSMYIGLVSIFLPFIGALTALAAIILGHSALRKIRQSQGTLIGRQSAVMGLYFGYISLALIASYSIFIYFAFGPPPASDSLLHSASTPASIALTGTMPTPAAAPSPPATVEATPTPTPATPAPVESPAPAPASPVASPDLQAATPPTPTPAPAPDSGAPQNTSTETAVTPTPAAMPPSTAPTQQTVISDGTGGNAASLLQNNPTAPATTDAPPSTVNALSVASVPPPSDTPAVYDPIVQNRLKDGMLAQPIPDDTSSGAYRDAEAFNNCARILSRPPEANYAESVEEFLKDVKTRNPDPARLQILTAMYENYLAGLKQN
jgi:hypothetical protein